MIQQIEEASMNAWPALQTVVYDGWILRFTNGYTRRANSINPLYPSKINLTSKIEYCQRLYDQKNLPTIFKITERVYPRNLDSVLEKAGYRMEAETSVQTVDLRRIKIPKDVVVSICQHIDATWIEHFIRLSKTDTRHAVTIRSMFESVVIRACFAGITDDNRIIACGMGALERDMLWLFDIVVDEHHRGKGLATKLIYGIFYWAKNNSAQLAYLQVMLDNESALSLYQRIGFKEVYRYWYRVRDLREQKKSAR